MAFRHTTPPHVCSYLPQQTAVLDYEWFQALNQAEYFDRVRQGWRRFGYSLFRPRCPRCSACRSLRVLADQFRPDRSQRRVARANQGQTELEIGEPMVSPTKLDLYRLYHDFQAIRKGWPAEHHHTPESYREAFVDNPFPTEEWCYFRDGKLVGVGYVDSLPAGLSAIYFFHHPDYRSLSLGTWNVLSIIEEARRRRLPHTYLGYYVAGCESMEYKARFRPNQVLEPDGQWHDFRR